MPLLYEPGSKHNCLVDHRYDVTLNRHHENIPRGTLWICPDCGLIYGYFGATRQRSLLVNEAVWEKVSPRQAQRIIRGGDRMIDWDELGTGTVVELQNTIYCVADIVEGKLARIRLGVYSEKQDGTLQEVLEEIERILR